MSHIKLVTSYTFPTGYLIVSCDGDGEEYYSFSSSYNNFESLSNYFYKVETADGNVCRLKLIDVFPEVEQFHKYTRNEIQEFLKPRETLIKTIFESTSDVQSQYHYCDCRLYKRGTDPVQVRSLRVDLLFQADWGYAILAKAFGWKSVECPSLTACQYKIDSAREFLDDNAGEIVVDPGYFLH